MSSATTYGTVPSNALHTIYITMRHGSCGMMQEAAPADTPYNGSCPPIRHGEVQALHSAKTISRGIGRDILFANLGVALLVRYNVFDLYHTRNAVSTLTYRRNLRAVRSEGVLRIQL